MVSKNAANLYRVEDRCTIEVGKRVFENSVKNNNGGIHYEKYNSFIPTNYAI